VGTTFFFALLWAVVILLHPAVNIRLMNDLTGRVTFAFSMDENL
jgi:hypothetical protein